MIHLVISPLPEVEVAQKGAVSLHPPVFSLLRDPCIEAATIRIWVSQNGWQQFVFDPSWITVFSPQRPQALEGVTLSRCMLCVRITEMC